jgi:tRNA1Val (adenine37-N6)-methyltransferase
MPNDYFQFQQFRIDQADCAQKVSTDACILGAAADLTAATRILDLGTGTGLLALMAAQRAPAATIEAIEIDPAAAAQATANAAASPWGARIRVHPLSLANYATTQPGLFSHIICNPPFFRRSLTPPNAARATARHEGENSLTFSDIIGFAMAHLGPGGTLTVLLPPPEMQQFEHETAAAGLPVRARLVVQHRPGGRATRSISTFRLGEPGKLRASNLVIQDADGTYSTAFRKLLSGFYLAL